jgi:NAD(P)-dependent dehydrogenase (short-subunit alcohol dehydrogenase family)
LGLLDGKSAIITGSARGIGRATAELFVAEGAKVLINDLEGDVAEEASNEIDGETAVFAGDLTKPGIPDQMVKAAIDAFGEVDCVVNNAGYTWDGVIHKMTDEQFQAMLDIHTIVPFRVIRALASPRSGGSSRSTATPSPSASLRPGSPRRRRRARRWRRRVRAPRRSRSGSRSRCARWRA